MHKNDPVEADLLYEAILSLKHLKQGLYIIHSGKTTYKFTKK